MSAKRYLLAIPLLAAAIFPCSTSSVRRLWSKSPGSQSTLFAFEQNGRVGFIDRKGKVVIPPTINERIENVGDFQDGFARVGSEGYIDQTGRWAVKGKFWVTNDFSDGLAWAYPEQQSTGAELQSVLLDRTGRTLANRKGTGVQAFSEGLAAFEAPPKPGVHDIGPPNSPVHFTSGLRGFLNRQGQVAIKPEFAHVGPFREGLALAMQDGYCHIATAEGGRWGSPTSGFRSTCGDAPDDAVTPCHTGFIDRTGRFAIEPRFESARDFQEHLAAVRVNGRWGFIDAKGTVVVPPQFDLAQSFSEGLAAVNIRGKWGFVGTDGQIRIPPVFENVEPFSDTRALALTGRGAFYIDHQGRTAIPGPFKEATPFVNGLASVLLSDTKVAYIDHAGKTVFQYSRTKSR